MSDFSLSPFAGILSGLQMGQAARQQRDSDAAEQAKELAQQAIQKHAQQIQDADLQLRQQQFDFNKDQAAKQSQNDQQQQALDLARAHIGFAQQLMQQGATPEQAEAAWKTFNYNQQPGTAGYQAASAMGKPLPQVASSAAPGQSAYVAPQGQPVQTRGIAESAERESAPRLLSGEYAAHSRSAVTPSVQAGASPGVSPLQNTLPPNSPQALLDLQQRIQNIAPAPGQPGAAAGMGILPKVAAGILNTQSKTDVDKARIPLIVAQTDAAAALAESRRALTPEKIAAMESQIVTRSAQAAHLAAETTNIPLQMAEKQRHDKAVEQLQTDRNSLAKTNAQFNQWLQKQKLSQGADRLDISRDRNVIAMAGQARGISSRLDANIRVYAKERDKYQQKVQTAQAIINAAPPAANQFADDAHYQAALRADAIAKDQARRSLTIYQPLAEDYNRNIEAAQKEKSEADSYIKSTTSVINARTGQIDNKATRQNQTFSKPLGRELSPAEIYHYARAAGYDAKMARTATAIALSESGGYSGMRAAKAGQMGVDRGLMQFNSAAHGDIADERVDDPLGAMQEAFKLSKGGKSWKDWTTYRTGAYTNYLPVVDKAITGSGGSNGPTSGKKRQKPSVQSVLSKFGLN